jgi:hypothetical protein
LSWNSPEAGYADEVDIIEHEEREDELAGAAVHDVKLKVKRKVGQVRVVPVPPEEFLISPRWTIFLDDCPFVGHRRKMTESDLIAAGFEPEQVSEIPTYSEYELGDERTQKFDDGGANEDDLDATAGQAMLEIMVTEAYPLVDWNGDGLAERVMVTLAGSQGQILRRVDGRDDVQEMGMQPFDAITPILISRKFFGRSVAELVTDIQRINTVLIRHSMQSGSVLSTTSRQASGRGSQGSEHSPACRAGLPRRR